MNPIAPFLIIGTLCLALGCASSPVPDEAPVVDRIVVTHSDSGDFDAADVRTLEIANGDEVARWVEALAAVPATPSRGPMFIKFAPNTPEQRVELYRGETLVTSHRLKGMKLDIPGDEGWSFYGGDEDQAFTRLVRDLVTGG